MAAEIVTAVYVPKEGREAALLEILKRHVPTLRKEGLATERPVVLMRSSGGALVEVFEWADAKAADQAHTNPRVAELWGAMMPLCEFGTLADLPEADGRFPHFEAVDGIVR